VKTAASRALHGVRLGISISESAGSQGLGFDAEEVNRTVERLCRDMLAQGAGLIFGHDWRAGGVMERVLGFAQTYQQPADGEPLLINLVPWPDGPALSPEERDFLSDVLRIEPIGLPPALAGKTEKALGDRTEGRAYLRARALTRLRRELTERCTARVCLGGKTRGYQGRLPGIVEEALFALEADRPLYLSAIFGGATADTINALSGQPMPPDPWEPADGFADAFAALANRTEPGEPDAELDPRGVWRRLSAIGLAKLAKDNGLSADENERLFRAQSASEVIDWIVVGLTRLRVCSGG
jgi:hypothetical protein